MAANNQGIMHLSATQGGRPFCRRRDAHMSTTVELSVQWPRLCVRCQQVLKKNQDRRARQAVRA